MATIRDLYEYLDALAPFDLQENYDNAGVIVGSFSGKVEGVLFALDATPEVIDEAIDRRCNVVVSHHPIVFRGMKRFNGETYVERAVMKAIKHDIALIAIHTNLDNVVDHGVNTKIAEKLGVEGLEALLPKLKSDHTDYYVGSGVVGYLPEPMETLLFLKHVKETMQAGCIRHTQFLKDQIHKVAICGGSGSFLLPAAINQEADIFITSDFKYHEFFDADGQIVIADIGHYESEQFTIELLYEQIKNNFSNFAAHCTNLNTNPVKYL